MLVQIKELPTVKPVSLMRLPRFAGRLAVENGEHRPDPRRGAAL